MLVILLWLIVCVARLATIPGGITDPELVGPDSFMRMVRVTQLYETGAWYDGAIARSNAPLGETLHWTRPLDVMIIALASPLMPIMGKAQSLHWAGVVVSPVLLFLTVLAMAWAARPLIPGPWRFACAVLLLAQPSIIAYASPGRADHHALIFLALALLFGSFLRLLPRGAGPLAAVAAGVVAGFGLWVSVELLVALAGCLTALGLVWVARGGAYAQLGARVGLGLVVAVTVALTVERPLADWSMIAYDRVSIVHLVFVGGVWTFWLTASQLASERYSFHRPGARIITGVIGAAVLAGVLYLVFPAFFKGPLASVDPRIVDIWLVKVVEMRSLWPDDWSQAGMSVMYLGSTIIALPLLLLRLALEDDADQRIGWLLIAAGYAALLPVAILHARFTPYVQLLSVFVLADAGRRFFVWTDHFRGMVSRVTLRATAAVLVILGPLLAAPAIGSGRNDAAGAAGTDGRTCPVEDIARYLDTPAAAPDGTPLTILTLLDYGPHLLYRTDHRVVGTPYHRNGDGIVDSHRMLAGPDDEETRALYRRRGVDRVLLCGTSTERIFFDSAEDDASLYRRLRDGRSPGWLIPEVLPAPVPDHVRLYRVDAARLRVNPEPAPEPDTAY